MSCASSAPPPWNPSRPADHRQVGSVHAHHSSMTSTLPASSRKCYGSRLRAAAQQRPSGWSHSTRTDPSTITSPTLTGSRTQIRPGIHGADQPTTEHNHSPPQRLTRAPVQIRSTPAWVRRSSAGRRLQQRVGPRGRAEPQCSVGMGGSSPLGGASGTEAAPPTGRRSGKQGISFLTCGLDRGNRYGDDRCVPIE